MTPTPNLLAGLAALFSFAAALLALYTAHRLRRGLESLARMQQAVHDSERAFNDQDGRLRLFDRRVGAVQAVEAEIGRLARSGLDDQGWNAFEALIAPVPYLFDARIHEFLDSQVRLLLERRSAAHHAYLRHRQGGAASNERLVELGVDLVESLDLVWKAAAQWRAMCAPYLQLAKPAEPVRPAR